MASNGGFQKPVRKTPGKGGARYYKNVGLGFKTPKEAIEGNKPPSPLSFDIPRTCPHPDQYSHIMVAVEMCSHFLVDSRECGCVVGS